MQEALQENKVTEKLKEKGYEPGIYVYGMVEPSASIVVGALFGVFAGNQPKPFVLNFSEKGIAFLELNTTCSKYTDLHNFVASDRIEKLSFKNGLLINTLTVQLYAMHSKTFLNKPIIQNIKRIFYNNFLESIIYCV